MTTKIGEIGGSFFHSVLELREFCAPNNQPGLQLTPLGGVFVQMSPDDVRRLAAVLLTWADSRNPQRWADSRNPQRCRVCGIVGCTNPEPIHGIAAKCGDV